MVFCRRDVDLHVTSKLINRKREEEFDRITYEVLWELATNHPESGIEKMECVEYYGRTLRETGLIRDGETEIWFKDFVHDVSTFVYGK